MEAEQLNRLLVIALAVSLLGSFIAAPMSGGMGMLGFAFGGVWSTLNVWAWKALVQEIFGPRRHYAISLIFFVKIPLLYMMGAFLVIRYPASLMWGAAGFQTPFLVIFLSLLCKQLKNSKPIAFI
ncbi:MAG: hypothetical protein AB1656_27505 [Candidatus Omnitrophota bacterium]